MKDADVQRAVTDLTDRGIPSEEQPLWWLTDLSALDARLDHLREVFPVGALHAVAVKANTQGPVLAHVASRGFGFEVASMGELELVAGLVAPAEIVYDAPAKTRPDLRAALDLGVRINADSVGELDRLAALGASSRVGVRVNPGGAVGKIAATSTGVPGSKFGVDLTEDGARLRERLNLPFLDGIHVHVGSQGGDLRLLVEGVRTALDFALSTGFVPSVFDVGGGLSVDYNADDDPDDMIRAWAEALRDRCPELFDGRIQVVTELGRYLHARHSVAISRVEAVKRSGGRRIAVVHLGADLLLRAVYVPNQWAHRVTVFDSNGLPKGGPLEPWDIAGPLCFSGDVIARARLLPSIREGDLIVVHDVGAYTMSMRSLYNSRPVPPVWYSTGSGA